MLLVFMNVYGEKLINILLIFYIFCLFWFDVV